MAFSGTHTNQIDHIMATIRSDQIQKIFPPDHKVSVKVHNDLLACQLIFRKGIENHAVPFMNS